MSKTGDVCHFDKAVMTTGGYVYCPFVVEPWGKGIKKKVKPSLYRKGFKPTANEKE